MTAANKEVRVTFKALDKTRDVFNRVKRNFTHLSHQLSSIKLGFGKLGGAIAAAFSTSVLKKIIDNGAEIGKLSTKLDVSTKSLSELKYAAGTCGLEFQTLTSGLEQLAIKTQEAATGGGKAAESLKLLGLSAKELSSLSPDQQFEQVADKLSRVADSSARAELAVRLFGAEGVKLLPILDQGASGIKALKDEAARLGASLSSEEAAAMAKFNEELFKLQTVLTSLLTSVLVPLLPAITAFFEAIRNGHPAITFIITAISSLLAMRLAAWFIGVTVAVRSFTAALVVNPLGLIAVAISTTVAALVTLVQWFKKGTESAGDYNKTLTETINLSNITIPKQALENTNKHNELQLEAKRIFEQTRTPMEKHNEQMAKLNRLLKEGMIDQDTFNRAMLQNEDQLANFGETSEDVFGLIKDRSNEASKSLIDNFSNAIFGVSGQVKDLKDIFTDFFHSMQADLLKMTMNKALGSASGGTGLLGSLFGGNNNSEGLLGGLFGNSSSFAGFFAGGGKAKAGKAHVVGDGGEPELFIPHSSGTIVPFNKQELTSISPNIVVNMNIQTPDISSFNYSRGQIAADMARQIVRSSRNL